jgi:hypothetical protein
MSLAEWLLERFAEDEADANKNRGTYPSPVTWDDGAVALHIGRGGSAVVTYYRDPIAGYDDMASLRRWAEPASEGRGWTRGRVLAECEAKRRIVEWATTVYAIQTGGPRPRTGPNPILALLALPYADHPDDQPEWRV